MVLVPVLSRGRPSLSTKSHLGPEHGDGYNVLKFICIQPFQGLDAPRSEIMKRLESIKDEVKKNTGCESAPDKVGDI